LARNELGIALGGIRLPETGAPIARNTGVPVEGAVNLRGASAPFPPELLKRLYPSSDAYVQKVRQVAQSAARSGAIMPSKVFDYVRKAEKTDLL